MGKEKEIHTGFNLSNDKMDLSIRDTCNTGNLCTCARRCRHMHIHTKQWSMIWLRKWSDAPSDTENGWRIYWVSPLPHWKQETKKHNWIAIDKWHKIKINGNVDDEGDDDDGGGNGPNGSGNQRVRKSHKNQNMPVKQPIATYMRQRART